MISDYRIRYVRTRHGATMKSFHILVGLLAFLVAVGCGAGTSVGNSNGGSQGGPVAASITGTVSVGATPVSVAVDTTANKIYVANYGTPQTLSVPCQATGTNITLIDGISGSTSTLTPGNSSWNALAVLPNPATHAVYAIVQTYWTEYENGPCMLGNATLEVVTGAQPTAQFCATCQFASMAVNPQNNTIYLGNYINNSLTHKLLNSYVSVFSSTSTWNTQIDVSLMPLFPGAMAANPATNKIYVAAGGVSLIDGATNSLTPFAANVAVAGPSGLAVNSTTNRLYAADGASNVTVIDGATGSVIATIAVGVSPVSVAVDEQTNFIYVANAGNLKTGDPGSITVINGATNATTTLSDPNAKNPVGVALNLVTNTIYVANSGSNNVTVIDGAHN